MLSPCSPSKTLKPCLMETLSRLPSSACRRSHLDSASYRTLSRILSLCRDLSLKPENPNPYATPSSVADENQTADPSKFENPKSDTTVEALQLAVENIDSLDEQEIDVSSSDERLNLMVSDLSLLVGAPCDQTQSESGEFGPNGQKRDETDQNLSIAGELNHKKDQNQQVEVHNSSIHKIETGNDAVLDSRCQEMASDKEIEQLGEEERSKDNPFNETIVAGLVNVNMELSQEMKTIQLEPPNDISNLGNSNEDHFKDSIEEGEISDDAQDLDESDLDNKDEPLIDDESEKDLVNTRSDDKLATREDKTGVAGLEDPKVVNQSQGIEPSEEVHEIGKKRKRVLSTERKAKKKKAFRIKRAKKALQDGVKRLRLPPPVVKEKKKKPCIFYENGNCQNGDQCKYSHDFIPKTKSRACTHFARGECLKGDECPYDHNLSKYPCHKFASEGMCSRGANCKFSHNIQNTEGISVLPKEPSKELSEKSNAGKQTSKSKKLSIEAPLRVPKGVRFLSFGADTKQETPTTEQKSQPMEQNRTIIPNTERENIESKAAGISGGSGELSEASKILQEFLFCDLSSAM